MQIKKEDIGKYKYSFEYDFNLETLTLCRAIKTKLGYKMFGFYQGKWRFNDIGIVYIIKNKYESVIIDKNINDDIEIFEADKRKQVVRENKLTKLKEATDTDFIVNNVKGELYGFQKVGVQFLVENNGRAIINSDMGTGKSLQSLAYLVHEKINKTLIITPASVKWGFESEVNKWTNLKPFVIDSKTEFTIDIFNDNNVFIINYDILKKFFVQLTNFRFECLIIDEVQKIKSVQAIRSKLTKQIASKIPKVIMLTGTLMLSRPAELFNPLNILDGATWSDWWYFSRRYCAGHDSRWGYDFSGASNIEELKQKINKYYIRHLKEDVLKDLPEKVFIDVPVELDNNSRSKYNLAMNSFVEYLRDVKNKSKAEIEKSAQATTLVRLNELRQIATNGKINIIKELVKDIIEDGKKVIIFSSYNQPLRKLQEEFSNESVLLMGETPESIRKEAINSFQNEPKIKIFLCGYASGGVGITLTKASNVIFCDFPWNPSDISQAYSRAHRIGNKAKSINIYQIIARNTIDIKIKLILEEKQFLIDKLFESDGTNTVKSTNIINSLIEDIQKDI